ncbi:MAG TPA: hypothetical protein VGV57_07600 [Thermoleophilaceae bacterium]|nr:hypothetical protein [Thermoleophilaceae bacterium]
MTTEANKRLYGRWLSELWNGDLAVAEEIVRARLRRPLWTGEPEKVRASEALGRLLGETRGYFTDLGFAVEVGPIAEGEIVAARWNGGAPSRTARG